MRKKHVGLDFGTSQTKACIYDLETDKREFFWFKESNSYFLPSVVSFKKDRTLCYGNVSSTDIDETYRFFKIASAEDDEFRFQTKELKTDGNFYKWNLNHRYPPEIISVLFLTYVIFTIKEAFQIDQPSKKRVGGLLSLLKRPDVQVQTEFTFQMGLPTEWSQVRNVKRKIKFESILVIARQLVNKFNNKSSFEASTFDDLLNTIKEIQSQLRVKKKKAFEALKNDLGLSVYPENAAGLSFIINSGKILPGSYAALDIGGGSSDVSYFHLNADGKVFYYASESYLMASNNVYSEYYEGEVDFSELSSIERLVKNEVNGGTWEDDERLDNSLRQVNKNLSQALYRLFHKRVYWYNKTQIKDYTDQELFIYGGGAYLPILSDGETIIHDNGVRSSVSVSAIALSKIRIKDLISKLDIQTKNEAYDPYLDMLVVCLGLSYIKPDSDVDWFIDGKYHLDDGGMNRIEIPHPFNEDCYLYDVIDSKYL